MALALTIKILPIVIEIIKDLYIDSKLPTNEEKLNSLKSQLETLFPLEAFTIDELTQLVEIILPLIPPIEKEITGCFSNCRKIKIKR